ncbi:DHA2 family efflux MFS transporter permease subunit [Actinokineospora diospyrosa]|uniref:Drug resistance transporter, EmrB/QacA subfamily n=1 Tax=Actinokineospora diospyrosa TaxID=103728 RepID=A0ABT1I929_9PSEU|nr:DHA2 family efflux MFS transporter permease subunit [Actinokineospora diospyrosa]MCP2269046.1 drug resistance transporter, EmrB/QacA subfamily [Actinokineospora diospyrosa]
MTTIEAGAPAQAPYKWRWWVLVAVLAAEIMDLLDATVVGIAAPSIQDHLGGGSTMIQWVAAGYTLAFAVGLITGGRLGDRYGRRRMFLIGLGGFVLTSVLCGLALSPAMLVTSRILQGLFGAALIPQGFGVIRSIFPPKELGAAFGAFGPAMGLASVGGPILAGALVAWNPGDAGWRTVFLINLPIGLAAMALAWKVLPESRAEHAPKVDPVGMALVSTGLVLLIYPLVQGREQGWPGWVFAMLAASVPVLAVFGVHQVRRHRAGRAPLVEPALFTSRAFTGGLVVGVAFFAAMSGLILTLGLYLQLGLHMSALDAGIAVAPWALGAAIGAALSGAVLGRKYGRPVLQVGALIMAAGIVLVIAEFGSSGIATGWDLAPGLLVCGIGMGLLIAPFFDIVLAGVTLPMVGSASGVLNAVQQLGGAAGVAVLGTVFFQHFESGDQAGSVRAVLWVTVGLIVAVAVLGFLLPRRARPEDAE